MQFREGNYDRHEFPVVLDSSSNRRERGCVFSTLVYTTDFWRALMRSSQKLSSGGWGLG